QTTVTKPARTRAEFGSSRQQWETHIFDTAAFFTVSRKTVPAHFATEQFELLPDALNTAWRDGRATMVYAVTAEGRSFTIPRSSGRPIISDGGKHEQFSGRYLSAA